VVAQDAVKMHINIVTNMMVVFLLRASGWSSGLNLTH